MNSEELFEKAEKGLGVLCQMMEKNIEEGKRNFQRRLRELTDDEIIRVSKNPNLSEIKMELVENEMRRRGL